METPRRSQRQRCYISDEPFIYTFADDFFKSNNGKGRTKQMIETYEKAWWLGRPNVRKLLTMVSTIVMA